MSDAETTTPSVPPVRGKLVAAPRGPVVTAAQALCGWLLVRHAAGLVGRWVLAYDAAAEVRLTDAGLAVHARTTVLGRTVRDREVVIPREGLVRATREVRYPRLAMYAGLVALLVGSWLGIGLAIDGLRAASFSLTAAGIAIALAGLAVDFALATLVPGVRSECRLVLVPRRGAALCVSAVDPHEADLLLSALAARR